MPSLVQQIQEHYAVRRIVQCSYNFVLCENTTILTIHQHFRTEFMEKNAGNKILGVKNLIECSVDDIDIRMFSFLFR